MTLRQDMVFGMQRVLHMQAVHSAWCWYFEHSRIDLYVNNGIMQNMVLKYVWQVFSALLCAIMEIGEAKFTSLDYRVWRWLQYYPI